MRKVVECAETKSAPFTPLYALDDAVPDKIRTVARRMYGATSVAFTRAAERDLAEVERLGYERLPVCIAKTPASLSDDPALRGRPEGFEVTVRKIEISAGAGFLVVLTGDVMRMPGLPREPLAERIDLRDGVITGLR
jgi:formate--tetrahydrofolate ligase